MVERFNGEHTMSAPYEYELSGMEQSLFLDDLNFGAWDINQMSNAAALLGSTFGPVLPQNQGVYSNIELDNTDHDVNDNSSGRNGLADDSEQQINADYGGWSSQHSALKGPADTTSNYTNPQCDGDCTLTCLQGCQSQGALQGNILGISKAVNQELEHGNPVPTATYNHPLSSQYQKYYDPVENLNGVQGEDEAIDIQMNSSRYHSSSGPHFSDEHWHMVPEELNNVSNRNQPVAQAGIQVSREYMTFQPMQHEHKQYHVCDQQSTTPTLTDDGQVSNTSEPEWSHPALSLKDGYRRLRRNYEDLKNPNEKEKRALSIICGLSFKRVQNFYDEKDSQVEDSAYYTNTSGSQNAAKPRNFACTFPGCKLVFPTKHMWSRHEASIHCPQEVWICDHVFDDDDETVCGSVFYRVDKYTAHLRKKHSHNPQVANQMAIDCRQTVFPARPFRRQCGFCGKALLEWQERADHIANHFIDGMDMSEWRDPWPRGSGSGSNGDDDDNQKPDDDNNGGNGGDGFRKGKSSHGNPPDHTGRGSRMDPKGDSGGSGSQHSRKRRRGGESDTSDDSTTGTESETNEPVLDYREKRQVSISKYPDTGNLPSSLDSNVSLPNGISEGRVTADDLSDMLLGLTLERHQEPIKQEEIRQVDLSPATEIRKPLPELRPVKFRPRVAILCNRGHLEFTQKREWIRHVVSQSDPLTERIYSPSDATAEEALRKNQEHDVNYIGCPLLKLSEITPQEEDDHKSRDCVHSIPPEASDSLVDPLKIDKWVDEPDIPLALKNIHDYHIGISPDHTATDSEHGKRSRPSAPGFTIAEYEAISHTWGPSECGDVSQSPRSSRRRRRFSPSRREEVAAVRKVGACENCRMKKIRYKHALIRPTSPLTSNTSSNPIDKSESVLLATAESLLRASPTPISHSDRITLELQDFDDKFSGHSDTSADDKPHSLFDGMSARRIEDPRDQLQRDSSSLGSRYHALALHEAKTPYASDFTWLTYQPTSFVEGDKFLEHVRSQHPDVTQTTEEGSASVSKEIDALSNRKPLRRIPFDNRGPHFGMFDGDSNLGAIDFEGFPPNIPIPPAPMLPAEIECSLSFSVRRFLKPLDWTKHVHENIQPFTCTYAHSREPTFFNRKADWVRHENERHRHSNQFPEGEEILERLEGAESPTSHPSCTHPSCNECVVEYDLFRSTGMERANSCRRQSSLRRNILNSKAMYKRLQPRSEDVEGERSWTANSSRPRTSMDVRHGTIPDKSRIHQRPKHERVLCNQCTEYPEGFRGLHELRRHIDRQHTVLVKKWVCIVPSCNANEVSTHPKCLNNDRRYGAYYNAASHFRRAHFKTKALGRFKLRTIDEFWKRYGNGGGSIRSKQSTRRRRQWRNLCHTHDLLCRATDDRPDFVGITLFVFERAPTWLNCHEDNCDTSHEDKGEGGDNEFEDNQLEDRTNDGDDEFSDEDS